MFKGKFLLYKKLLKKKIVDNSPLTVQTKYKTVKHGDVYNIALSAFIKDRDRTGIGIPLRELISRAFANSATYRAVMISF